MQYLRMRSVGCDANPAATDKPELPEQPLSKPEVWVQPGLSPEVLAWLKGGKSVRWSTPVVSNIYVIDRLSKEQICGTKGVDDWKHEADTRTGSAHARKDHDARRSSLHRSCLGRIRDLVLGLQLAWS